MSLATPQLRCHIEVVQMHAYVSVCFLARQHLKKLLPIREPHADKAPPGIRLRRRHTTRLWALSQRGLRCSHGWDAVSYFQTLPGCRLPIHEKCCLNESVLTRGRQSREFGFRAIW